MNKNIVLEKLFLYIDRVLILYSIFTFLFSIYFFFEKEDILSIVPYLAESVLYLLLRPIFKNKIRILIYTYSFINTLLILVHIIIAIVWFKLILIELLSVFYGVIIISTFYFIFIINQSHMLTKSFIIYFLVLAVIPFFVQPIFKSYYKYAWVNICVKNSESGNYQLGVSKIKTREHCNCVYKIFIERYKKVKNFPAQKHYSRKDKMDVFNCTINFLVPDSLNKDSIRNHINTYLDDY